MQRKRGGGVVKGAFVTDFHSSGISTTRQNVLLVFFSLHFVALKILNTEYGTGLICSDNYAQNLFTNEMLTLKIQLTCGR